LAIRKHDLEQIIQELKSHRKFLLDTAEVVAGASPHWMLLRSKIMSVFGRDGLEGAILELIDKSEGRQDGRDESR